MCPPIGVDGSIRSAAWDRQVVGRVDVADGPALGIEPAPRRLGDDRRRQRVVSARSRRSPPSTSRRAASNAGSRRTTSGNGRGRPSCSRTTASTPGVIERHAASPARPTRRATACRHRRRGRSIRPRGGQPGEQSASGPSNATGSWVNQSRRAGQVGMRVRARRPRRPRRPAADRIDRVPQQRPARRSAPSSLSRPKRSNGRRRGRSRRRPAARLARWRARPPVGHRRTNRPRWPPVDPARARRGFAAGSRADRGRSRIAITYLRLVPVASRSAAGVSGAAPARARRGRLDRPVRRRGVGEAGLEHDDPAAAFELADARPAGNPRRGPPRRGRAAPRPRGRARGGPSRPRAPRSGSRRRLGVPG